eukprot:6808126-Alexandrium_andersonii.AAC.1
MVRWDGRGDPPELPHGLRVSLPFDGVDTFIAEFGIGRPSTPDSPVRVGSLSEPLRLEASDPCRKNWRYVAYDGLPGEAQHQSRAT